MSSREIDTAFDFRIDAGGGDPDRYSPTLRRYHQLLWSKPLRSGAIFDLSDKVPGVYLHHHSPLGEFRLKSDSVMQTFTRWESLRPITEQRSDAQNTEFASIAYTIGGMLIFPGNQINARWTIKAGAAPGPSPTGSTSRSNVYGATIWASTARWQTHSRFTRTSSLWLRTLSATSTSFFLTTSSAKTRACLMSAILLHV